MTMKIFTALFLVFLACAMVFAAPLQGDGKGQNDSQEKGQNVSQGAVTQNDNDSMAQNQGENQSPQDNQTQAREQEQEREQVRAQNQTAQDNATAQVQERAQMRNEVRERIQQSNSTLGQELNQVRAEVRSVYENQNRVRLAVHALLDMENLTGGIGKNVSAIAREFNNSVQATIKAEERIQTRSAVWRFLFGGDEVAAANLTQETTQNQLRIQQLNQLRNQCDCDNETKAMLQEQIQQLEQEQTRLHQLAQNETQSKGLLGWLWK